jgi:hypothetical protein
VQLQLGQPYYYYHADLGPTNIMVSCDGNVNGVIDWESAGFYPHFWIGTKPRVSGGFVLEGLDGRRLEGDEWKGWLLLLHKSLEEKGFGSDLDQWRVWSKAVKSQ